MDERDPYDEPVRSRSGRTGDRIETTYTVKAVPEPKTRRSYKPAILAGGIAAALAAGVAIGWIIDHGDSSKNTPAGTPVAAATSSSEPATIDLSGSMTLQRGAFLWGATGNTDLNCAGRNGYNDIAVGAPVTITNQAGTVIATTSLHGGRVNSITDGAADSCEFEFSVTVPATPFYGVTVSHRGTLTYSQADARTGNINLTLGG